MSSRRQTGKRSGGRALGAALVLLALWLQALAPAAGLTARARALETAAADALIHAALCGSATADPAADLPGAPPACDHCPFCRCPAAAPLPLPPQAAPRRLAWSPALWPIPPPARPARPPRTQAQARAPPVTV
ncbi:hypothetical protein Q8W71_10430 [Methylobacterium sp. NEAU 140]|uniref:DUF2946 family protein n=1 Tax=Methylobacterium sp. NEAU 140 TaxID=3064945 RepID=UPI0027331991|nr:DUF2946 family protein [Methylobacterium sp. NEAU 140]MDP4023041.1 hypothetical protein [Methylobacterium sp. NEAU 140]